MLSNVCLAVLLLPALIGHAAAQATVPTSVPATTAVAATTTAAAQTTAITGCHLHDTTQFCIKGNGDEVQVKATPTGSAPLPTAYEGCHAHGTETFCIAPDGSEVEIVAAPAEAGHSEDDHDHDDHDHDDHAHAEEAEEAKENCHFHAGVEHCTGGSATATCERRERDYNIGLRVGLIFPMLAVSALAVYAPMILSKLLKINTSSILFTIIKQFGTGVIVATAFVHLLTHANLMFGNECLGDLAYEGTTTAIALAGAFLAFLIEYLGHRLSAWRARVLSTPGSPGSPASESPHDHLSKEPLPHTHDALPHEPHTANPETGLATLSHHHHVDPCVALAPNDAVSVLVLEAGIVFHSILLGITLVVAGDAGFATLYVVIVFHQLFEGLALGARIASLASATATKTWLLPITFALVTPVGMAIGIGVLHSFNGNSPATIVALGTLDAISAGILAWVGLVSMWANDWLYGELREAKLLKTGVAFGSLMAGMVLMGVLGKWA